MNGENSGLRSLGHKKKRLSESEKFQKKICRPSKNDKRQINYVIYKRCFEPNGSYPYDSKKSLQSSIGIPEKPVIQNFKA